MVKIAAVLVAAAALGTPVVAMAQGNITGEQQVTFTKHVAPILYKSCVNCHRPGEIAPMSLVSYDDARPFARSIRARVAAREMPPWRIDRTVGIQKFKNDPSLSEEEIATIVKWVDRGAPQGNPADLPPAPQFASASSWQIGEPDLVVRFPPFTVPASGPDLFGSLTTSLNLKEDRYIKAIQTRPADAASRKVIHHSGVTAVPVGGAGEMAEEEFLAEYASGKGPEIYPDNAGVLLRAGQNARFGYHLHSVGEEIQMNVEVGLVFHPKGTVPKHVRYTKQLAQPPTTDLDIPAGKVVRVDGYTRLNKAARITAFQPHMHIRGKYQCLELIYPSTPIVTEMVSCAEFDYNWHLVYNYADDVAPLVPAGTILHVISWHDNSTANPHNPDPKNWVGFDQRTIDEMGFSWIGWHDLSDEEYATEIAARKALRSQKTTN